MLRSDVAGPAADAGDNPFFRDGLHPTIEIAELSAFSQLERQPAMVQASVEKSWQPDFRFLQSWGGDELVKAVADEAVKILAQYLGKTAIRHTNLAFERKREDSLVEAIDQLAIVMLRTGNYVDEFLKLPLARRSGGRQAFRFCS